MPSPPWHPIFHAAEPTPGVWELWHPIDVDGPYGRIELRRVGGGELRYKVTLGSKHIGWSTTLQVACERLYKAYIEQDKQRRGGAPNAWPDQT